MVAKAAPGKTNENLTFSYVRYLYAAEKIRNINKNGNKYLKICIIEYRISDSMPTFCIIVIILLPNTINAKIICKVNIMANEKTIPSNLIIK